MLLRLHKKSNSRKNRSNKPNKPKAAEILKDSKFNGKLIEISQKIDILPEKDNNLLTKLD